MYTFSRFFKIVAMAPPGFWPKKTKTQADINKSSDTKAMVNIHWHQKIGT
jgi:hypothetical protein